MQKKSLKKLTLNRETLRALENAAVVGGVPSFVGDPGGCAGTVTYCSFYCDKDNGCGG